MRYRALGKTGLHVSTIGFGASALGDVFGQVTPQDAHHAVERALERGITFFDVSPYYGVTRAEARLGQLLEGSRDKVVLATKCGRYGANHFDFSAETILREFDNSLKRLRTDRVDLLQAHDIEFGDIGQILRETIPAMRRLQQQGRAGAIGITSYWPGLLARVAAETAVDTVLNYCHSNLLMDDMSQELEPLAANLGVGLINASPLHMGLLGGGIIPDWHPAPQTVRNAAADIVALCRRFGQDPGTIALWACLQNSGVQSTLIGMASSAQVDLSCRALDLTPDPALLEAIQICVAPIRNTVWPSGLPENTDAGQHTPAPSHPGLAAPSASTAS